ncbi:hypothetical protein C0Z18_07145 [Trinickia dabaoshanensis]|uniref:Uncharacterized protein n=1 Tax=Trinickia dabaoshanensis TaxID=564714 RepID=A0A2N7VWU6_9BURK|nr:hypothetical protein C0Z18_07145 [Trinickia dabaoshanensis]
MRQWNENIDKFDRDGFDRRMHISQSYWRFSRQAYFQWVESTEAAGGAGRYRHGKSVVEPRHRR